MADGFVAAFAVHGDLFPIVVIAHQGLGSIVVGGAYTDVLSPGRAPWVVDGEALGAVGRFAVQTTLGRVFRRLLLARAARNARCLLCCQLISVDDDL